MRVTPSVSNTIGFFDKKFEKGQWTEINYADADYLLCRWCAYYLKEEHPSGPYWVRNVGKRSSFKFYDMGNQKRLSLKPGEDAPVDRYIAHQLLRRHDIEETPMTDVFPFVSKVLVIRYGGLGDVLMTLPCVAAAKRNFPHVSFGYSTADPYVRIFEGNEYVDHSYGYEGYDADSYEAVIDLRRVVEVAKDSGVTNRIDIFARYFGVEVEDYSMDYKVTDKDRGEIDAFVPESYVVVQASGSIPRRTPPKAKILEILKGLVEAGLNPVVVDSVVDGDYSLHSVTNLTGKLTIAQLFAVVERADFVIAGDSGVLHVANSLKKRNLGLFGCVESKLRIKGQPHCETIQCNQWSGCEPCNDHQTKTCDRPDLCLAYVPTELILEKVAG